MKRIFPVLQHLLLAELPRLALSSSPRTLSSLASIVCTSSRSLASLQAVRGHALPAQLERASSFALEPSQLAAPVLTLARLHVFALGVRSLLIVAARPEAESFAASGRARSRRDLGEKEETTKLRLHLHKPLGPRHSTLAAPYSTTVTSRRAPRASRARSRARAGSARRAPLGPLPTAAPASRRGCSARRRARAA